MYNGLVRIKPGQASPQFIEPDLAESWTSSADGLTWTFKLRRGVQCHGKYGEFDAEDAVFLFSGQPTRKNPVLQKILVLLVALRQPAHMRSKSL